MSPYTKTSIKTRARIFLINNGPVREKKSDFLFSLRLIIEYICVTHQNDHGKITGREWHGVCALLNATPALRSLRQRPVGAVAIQRLIPHEGDTTE